MIFARNKPIVWPGALLLLLFALTLAACAPSTPAVSPAPSSAESAATGPIFDSETLNPAVALDEMAGHLYTSWQLWQVENYPLSAMHAGHTLGESLPQVEGTLQAEALDALKAALTTYQTAASVAGDQAAAQHVYDGAVEAIAAARQSLPHSDDPRFQAAVMRDVLETVEREYAEGVDAGKIVNIAEYQDSFGFVAVIQAQYPSLSPAVQERDADGDAEIAGALEKLGAAFAAVMPVEPLTPLANVAAETDEIRAELGKIFELTDAAALSTEDILALVREMTQHAVDEYAEGKSEEAYELAADAYLEGFEHLEGPLLEKDRELVETLEGQFKALRDQIKAGAPLADVQSVAVSIGENMDKAEALLK